MLTFLWQPLSFGEGENCPLTAWGLTVKKLNKQALFAALGLIKETLHAFMSASQTKGKRKNEGRDRLVGQLMCQETAGLYQQFGGRYVLQLDANQRHAEQNKWFTIAIR